MTRFATSLFTAGGVLHLLTAAAHTVGHFASREPKPEEARLVEQMKQVGGEMMGMHFSTWSVLNCLSLYMSVFGVTVGLLCLFAKGALAAHPGALRRVGILCALSAALLAGIAFWAHLAPPATFYVLTTLCFTAVAIKA